MIKSAKEHYRLTYFDVRNLAEPTRMVLAYVNQPFDDIRIQMNEWMSLKPNMPFGTMPLLELGDGRKLNQSRAILKYVAKRHGLGGKDIWQEAQLEELSDFQSDIHKAFSPYFYNIAGIVPGDTETLRREVFLPKADQYLPMVERLLDRDHTRTGFLAEASAPTYADFIYADYFYTVRGIEPEVMRAYPAICAHIEKIFTLPKLKPYIESRPKSIF